MLNDSPGTVSEYDQYGNDVSRKRTYPPEEVPPPTQSYHDYIVDNELPPPQKIEKQDASSRNVSSCNTYGQDTSSHTEPSTGNECYKYVLRMLIN